MVGIKDKYSNHAHCKLLSIGYSTRRIVTAIQPSVWDARVDRDLRSWFLLYIYCNFFLHYMCWNGI